MIKADDAVFPNNIVSLVKVACKLLDDDPDENNRVAVFGRPLRESDPVQAIGVFAVQWTGEDESTEMRGTIGGSMPTLQTYRCVIQAFVKDMEEERGLNAHSVLSQMVRRMLYRDQPLAVALTRLTASVSGYTERVNRWGISNQRFISNELSGNWLYLSNLEFWVETETV